MWHNLSISLNYAILYAYCINTLSEFTSWIPGSLDNSGPPARSTLYPSVATVNPCNNCSICGRKCRSVISNYVHCSIWCEFLRSYPPKYIIVWWRRGLLFRRLVEDNVLYSSHKTRIPKGWIIDISGRDDKITIRPRTWKCWAIITNNIYQPVNLEVTFIWRRFIYSLLKWRHKG